MNERRRHIVQPRILFAAGGTGGHVYPAIAIADAVVKLYPGATIAFAGTRDRLEWTAVPKAGYPIHAITVSGFQRSLSRRNLTFPFKLLRGITESWSLVGAFDPDVVVGTGGYVSGPVLWTAGFRGRPTLIQEQNAYAGVTNRLLGRRAARIHLAFEEAKKYFPPAKCRLSGNPVRAKLAEANRDEAVDYFGLPQEARVVFVFGGSLGSEALNREVRSQLDIFLSDPETHLIWQTGPRYFDAIDAEVSNSRVTLLSYVDRMDLAYAAADVVIARAGAITCSELMVTGRPSILVPSPNVAEDHQTRNAEALSRRGAAILLPETELHLLAATLNELLDDQDRRREMSRAVSGLARPEAADTIARDVLELAGRSQHEPSEAGS